MPITTKPQIFCRSEQMHAWKEHQRVFGSQHCCDLCTTRNKVCLFRGQIPCDVLFIGEGPGEAENLTGLPFIGPAGNLLDQMISSALSDIFPCLTLVDLQPCLPSDSLLCDNCHSRRSIRIGFGNLIACIPWNENRDGVRQPSSKEIKACRTRLLHLVDLCHPTYVVLCGLVPAKHFPRSEFSDLKYLELSHPSSILRLNDDPHQQRIETKKFVLGLINIFQELVNG